MSRAVAVLALAACSGGKADSPHTGFDTGTFTTPPAFEAAGTWVGTCEGELVDPSEGYYQDPRHVVIDVELVLDHAGGDALTGHADWVATFDDYTPGYTPPTTGTFTPPAPTTPVIEGDWLVDGTQRGGTLELSLAQGATATTPPGALAVVVTRLVLGPSYSAPSDDRLEGSLVQPPDEYDIENTVPCTFDR